MTTICGGLLGKMTWVRVEFPNILPLVVSLSDPALFDSLLCGFITGECFPIVCRVNSLCTRLLIFMWVLVRCVEQLFELNQLTDSLRCEANVVAYGLARMARNLETGLYSFV